MSKGPVKPRTAAHIGVGVASPLGSRQVGGGHNDAIRRVLGGDPPAAPTGRDLPVSSTLPDRVIVDLGTFTPQHTFLDIPAGSISPTAGLVWDVQAVLAIGGTADDGAVTALLVGEPALGYIGQSAPIGPTFGEARLEVSTSQVSGTLLHLYVFTNVVPTADSGSGYLVATPRGIS